MKERKGTCLQAEFYSAIFSWRRETSQMGVCVDSRNRKVTETKGVSQMEPWPGPHSSVKLLQVGGAGTEVPGEKEGNQGGKNSAEVTMMTLSYYRG